VRSKRLLSLIAGVCLVVPLLAACAAPAPAEPGTAVTTTVTAAAKTTTVTAAAKTTTVTAAAPTSKVYNLRMPVNYGPAESWFPIAEQWSADVKAASGGRLNIEVLPMNEVVPISEAWEAVGDGIVDMAAVYAGYHAGKLPVGQIECALPFTFRSAEEQAMFWWNYGFIDFLNEEVYPEHNTYVLGHTYFSGYQFWLKEPAHTVADLQGMSLRVSGGLAKILGKLDISTTYITGTEIYTALQTGVIDGAAYGGIVQGTAYHFYEVAKYILSPAVYPVSNVTIYINTALWNEMPDDLKAILEVSVQDLREETTRDFDINELKLPVILQEEHGVQYTELEPEDLQKMKTAGKEYYAELATQSPSDKKAIDMLSEFLEEIGNPL